MIASLRGTVVGMAGNSVVVDVNGVGYSVLIPSRTALEVTLNSEQLFHTSMVVREDSINLYGFQQLEELRTFENLCSVTGVGPKLSLAIISALSNDQISEAVAREDDSVFRSVSGVGQKTAKLICVSLAGKLGAGGAFINEPSQHADLISALIGLGWNERNAREAISSIAKQQPDADSNSLLKSALALLGSSKSVGVAHE